MRPVMSADASVDTLTVGGFIGVGAPHQILGPLRPTCTSFRSRDDNLAVPNQLKASRNKLKMIACQSIADMSACRRNRRRGHGPTIAWSCCWSGAPLRPSFDPRSFLDVSARALAGECRRRHGQGYTFPSVALIHPCGCRCGPKAGCRSRSRRRNRHTACGVSDRNVDRDGRCISGHR